MQNHEIESLSKICSYFQIACLLLLVVVNIFTKAQAFRLCVILIGVSGFAGCVKLFLKNTCKKGVEDEEFFE